VSDTRAARSSRTWIIDHRRDHGYAEASGWSGLLPPELEQPPDRHRGSRFAQIVEYEYTTGVTSSVSSRQSTVRRYRHRIDAREPAPSRGEAIAACRQ